MSRVRLNQAEVLRTPRRAALPLVVGVTRQVLSGAKALAPRGTHMSGNDTRRPGQHLSASINASTRATNDLVMSRVGSTNSYAATAHQGSKPHIIRRTSGGLLKFRWVRGNFLLERRGRRGRTYFYFRFVKHPGNKRPTRYLTTPLVMFGRLANMKVTTVGPGRTRLP